MSYTLKKSEKSIEILGKSRGLEEKEPDGSFWITGWMPDTRDAIRIKDLYILSNQEGKSNPVEVIAIGGDGLGGIRFKKV